MGRGQAQVLVCCSMVFAGWVSLQGCTALVQRPAVQVMSQIAHDGFAAYARETDLPLAEHAFAATLKLLEALLETDPQNAALLLQAAQGFAGYTYAFVEPRIEEARGQSASQVAWHTQRARQLYQRGMQYGLRLLSQKHRDWLQAPSLPPEQLQGLLQRLSQDATPALLWTSFCWGGWLNFERTDLEAVTMMAPLQALVTRLLSLDETHFYGLPHLLQAVLHAGMPAWMGGNPTLAAQHFARATALSQGRLLLVPLLEAQYAAVQTQNRPHFTRLLCSVVEAPERLFPEQGLLNTVAQQRAAMLLRRGDELFFEPGEPCNVSPR